MTKRAKKIWSPRPHTTVRQRIARRLVEKSHARRSMVCSPSTPVKRAKWFSVRFRSILWVLRRLQKLLFVHSRDNSAHERRRCDRRVGDGDGDTQQTLGLGKERVILREHG